MLAALKELSELLYQLSRMLPLDCHLFFPPHNLALLLPVFLFQCLLICALE